MFNGRQRVGEQKNCHIKGICRVCGEEFEGKENQILCEAIGCRYKYHYLLKHEGMNMKELLSGETSSWIKFGFEQFPFAQELVLESPTGEIFWIKNLKGFIAEYKELFEEKRSVSAYNGVRRMKQSMIVGDGQTSDTWSGLRLLGFRG